MSNQHQHQSNVSTAFDEDHAAAYDQRFARIASLRDALHLMMKVILSPLPENAHVLCVGAGTGLELADLAQRFSSWRFTAVEPAPAMLKICRQRAEKLGLTDRCTFHEGYLDTLPPGPKFDAATSLLVSHFILQREDRLNYFRQIASRLRPGGWLVNADLSGDAGSDEYPAQMDAWLRMMQHADLSEEQLQNMRAAYARDVAILPPREVADLIASSGFERPVPFHQALLIHGWFARAR
jgi:tRNA (cmo5U34)-methyltransferase